MYFCNLVLFARSRVLYSGHPSQSALCGPEQFGQQGGALHPSLPCHLPPTPPPTRALDMFVFFARKILRCGSVLAPGTPTHPCCVKGDLQNLEVHFVTAEDHPSFPGEGHPHSERRRTLLSRKALYGSCIDSGPLTAFVLCPTRGGWGGPPHAGTQHDTSTPPPPPTSHG